MIRRVLALVAMLSIACACLTIGLVGGYGSLSRTRPTADASIPSKLCYPLPSSFQESDLLGRWVARYGAGGIDVLVLRADGTYKQIFDAPVSGFHYESDWRKWYIERRDSGWIRLHLDGMRRCDDTSDMCQREEGGIDGSAIDYCEQKGASMQSEVVLLVTGASPKATGLSLPILLWHMRLPGSPWVESFEHE
ncbi:MAG: hypothetical protein HZB53_03625 [Chloroflexi bacterium]|nr:hypothetical protein [Chloroflexota bacterium]